MKKLLVIIEKTATGYAAYSPDLDGVGATGDTRDETELLMRRALELHLEAMREEGIPVPEPQSYATYVEVAA
jgi:predicted RNase H-like HicB family nuclease